MDTTGLSLLTSPSPAFLVSTTAASATVTATRSSSLGPPRSPLRSFSQRTPQRHRHHHPLLLPRSTPIKGHGEGNHVEALTVPESWMDPSNALQESEWLRVTLHKWLDDEYCPEPANIEISKVAAESYYESLLAKQSDLGEILLRMVKALESVSFQESFHGAFSSANAAVHLITLRMESIQHK